MNRSLVITVLSLGLSLGSFAQQEWDLEKCISHAIQENIQVKQSMLNVESANSSYQQSRMGILPNLNGFASHGYNWGQRIDPFTNTFATDRVQSNSFSLSSSMTLFGGLSTYNSIRASRYSKLAALEDVDAMRNDIAMTVASSYLAILFNYELATNATAQVELSQQQVDRVSKQVEAGAVARGTLLDLEAQLASDELNLVRAENSLQLSVLALTQIMMLTPEESANFSIVRPNLTALTPTDVPVTATAVYDAAIGRLPQVRASEYRIQSAERSMSSAQGAFSPTLSMDASYGTGYSGASVVPFGDPVIGVDTFGFTSVGGEAVLIPSFDYETRTKPFGDQLRDNINTNLNFRLSVPIFNGWSVRNNVSQARISQESAKLTLESTLNTIRTDVYQSHADAGAALRRFKAAKRSLTAQEESFKYARVRYEEGITNTVEFNDAKNRLAAAQSELVQARYDYLFKLKILDFYQGKPLGF